MVNGGKSFSYKLALSKSDGSAFRYGKVMVLSLKIPHY